MGTAQLPRTKAKTRARPRGEGWYTVDVGEGNGRIWMRVRRGPGRRLVCHVEGRPDELRPLSEVVGNGWRWTGPY